MPRGGAVNDDALGCTAQAAWVIDGATSIGRSVLGVESDARWLAQAVDRHLRLLLEVEPEQSSETLLRRLLNDIQGDFRAQSGRDWHDLEDMPAACLSLLRIRGGEIELLNIGDSRILVEGADGQVRSFGDSALHELDRQSWRISAGCARNIRSGITPNCSRPAARACGRTAC